MSRWSNLYDGGETSAEAAERGMHEALHEYGRPIDYTRGRAIGAADAAVERMQRRHEPVPGARAEVLRAIANTRTGLPEDLDGPAVDALTDAVMPVLAELVDQERERIAGEIAAELARVERVRAAAQAGQRREGRMAGLRDAVRIARGTS